MRIEGPASSDGERLMSETPIDLTDTGYSAADGTTLRRQLATRGTLVPDGNGGTTDLVLEGGGVKGIGLVGAVEALMEGGYTFYRVAGTSAGAIVAALLAALTQSPDHDVKELTDIMNRVQYKNFKEAPPHGHAKTGGTDRGPAFWRTLRQHGLHTAWYLTD